MNPIEGKATKGKYIGFAKEAIQNNFNFLIERNLNLLLSIDNNEYETETLGNHKRVAKYQVSNDKKQTYSKETQALVLTLAQWQKFLTALSISREECYRRKDVTIRK